MIETGVVKDLIDQLLNGDKEQQAAAALHVRQVLLLCVLQETALNHRWLPFIE